MNYCVINYDDPDIRPLHEFGTVAPITPEITGLLLQELPDGFRIVSGTQHRTDLNIIACKLEKTPNILPGTTPTPPEEAPTLAAPVERIVNIVPSPTAGTIYKNSLNIFEKILPTLFKDKKIFISNSTDGTPVAFQPAENEIYIAFNCYVLGSSRNGSCSFSINYETDEVGKNGVSKKILVSSNRGYSSSQLYENAILDSNSRIIMQGEDNVIYVHWNPLTCISDTKIFALTILPMYIEQELKIKENPDQHCIDNIVESYKRSIANTMQDTKNRLRDTETKIRDYKSSLITLYDTLQSQKYIIFGFDDRIAGLKDEINDMFLECLKFPQIKQIKSFGSIVTVHTNELFYRKNKTEIYFIGKFKILIDVSNFTVVFINTTYKVNAMNTGMNAPHVYSDGHACLGSIETQLPNTIKECRLDNTILLAISFLQSVNESDQAGKHFYKWPKVIDGKIVFESSKYITVLDNKYDNGKELTV